MPHPTTEIFAFSQPKIKGGQIHVAVNLGAGTLHVLEATSTVWGNLHRHLHAIFGPRPAESAPSPAPAKRYLRGAERDRVYGSVLALVQEHGCSQPEACRRVGVAYTAFHSWLVQKRAREPIAKPNGRLL